MRSIPRRSLMLLPLMAALFVCAAPARAITYGFVDSTNAYPNVGAFIVRSPSGLNFPICSGTLITPNVFLTAGHCTDFFNASLVSLGFTAFATLDQSVPFGSLTSPSTTLLAVTHVVTNPAFSQAQGDSGDLGVLILASPVAGITPAKLPACGLLDQLSAKNGLKDAIFTAVGYGVQNRVVGGGVPFFQDLNPVPRMFAFSAFNALNKGYIRLSQNPSLGNGGTCFGDSGGPNFLTVNGTQTLAAVTITGDTACRSTNVDYRLDTASAQRFFEFVNSTYGTSIPTSSC